MRIKGEEEKEEERSKQMKDTFKDSFWVLMLLLAMLLCVGGYTIQLADDKHQLAKDLAKTTSAMKEWRTNAEIWQERGIKAEQDLLAEREGNNKILRRDLLSLQTCAASRDAAAAVIGRFVKADQDEAMFAMYRSELLKRLKAIQKGQVVRE